MPTVITVNKRDWSGDRGTITMLEASPGDTRFTIEGVDGIFELIKDLDGNPWLQVLRGMPEPRKEGDREVIAWLSLDVAVEKRGNLYVAVDTGTGDTRNSVIPYVAVAQLMWMLGV